VPCIMESGSTRAVIRVEQDTMLPSTGLGASPLSFSSVVAADTLQAGPGTPMPGARVRMLELDSTTRADLAAHGVREAEPTAFIRVFPYGAGCEPLRWRGTAKFVIPGEVGYIRAQLAPRDEWVGSAPLFIVFPGNPYPGRRTSTAGLASPEALFRFDDTTDLNIPMAQWGPSANLAVRRRAIAWAKANLQQAELEPIRSAIREMVLNPDWGDADEIPSRLRGTYRVDIETGGQHVTWYFRTHDRPSFSWRGPDSLQHTTARLLATPHIDGYRLVGYGAPTRDSLMTKPFTGGSRYPLVWLATTDRPTTPGNDARRTLSGTFQFMLDATPDSTRGLIDPISRDGKEAFVPITVRLDGRGGVRADTSIVVGVQRFRVSLQRIDTVAVKRPW
jgi:hypothetical protein